MIHTQLPATPSPYKMTGSCHCGGVKFELEREQGQDLGQLIRCNCSLCSRKGAVMASVKIDRLNVLEGAELLTLYQWNTGIAKHYFCSRCGIYTHHQRRSVPDEYGVNVACITPAVGIDAQTIVMVDGASRSVVKEHE